jgi:hypothetical protein
MLLPAKMEGFKGVWYLPQTKKLLSYKAMVIGLDN